MQSDWLNSALSPVVYGDIALSINTQYNTMQYLVGNIQKTVQMMQRSSIFSTSKNVFSRFCKLEEVETVATG